LFLFFIDFDFEFILDKIANNFEYDKHFGMLQAVL